MFRPSKRKAGWVIESSSRQRALELGLRISQQYRESEERFRTLNELLPALVLLADRADGRPGVKVHRVLPGPARAAGILEGDVIVAVDGDATSTLFALRWALEQRTWGERPVFTVERGGDRQDRQGHVPHQEDPQATVVARVMRSPTANPDTSEPT